MSIKAVRKHCDMRIEVWDGESAEHGAIRGVRKNHQGQKTRNTKCMHGAIRGVRRNHQRQKTRNTEQSVGIMNN